MNIVEMAVDVAVVGLLTAVRLSDCIRIPLWTICALK